MAYDPILADRIRAYLSEFTGLEVEEKEMFRGLTFMVNGKMCVSVSDENLMCRFDPSLQEEVAEKNGYQPLIMKGKQYQGYCFVDPTGLKRPQDFAYWMNLGLAYNERAKASKKKKKK